MLLAVHKHRIFRSSKMKYINTDLIKSVEAATHGNYARDSNALIIFTDGTRMKVIDSAVDIRSYHNCGRPAFRD